MKKEFNGYSFSDPSIVKRMKYLVVEDAGPGLTDICGFEQRKELNRYLRSFLSKKVVGVFRVKSVVYSFK